MLVGTRQFSAIVAALFAVVASLFVIPAVHAAESDPVTVRGTVISHDGQPLASVRVSFETCVDEFPLGLVCVPENSGDTDGDGGFEIQVAQNTALRIVFDADDNVHSTQVWNGQGE